MGGDISGWSARPLKSQLRRTRPLIQIIIAPPPCLLGNIFRDQLKSLKRKSNLVFRHKRCQTCLPESKSKIKGHRLSIKSRRK
ncbi:hypothetical protein NC652_039755 [Populus alba x Populus x berolinensis]|nr:hypothetical protein NC652_039755 [Populus alba x Populus x berolinensis]